MSVNSGKTCNPIKNEKNMKRHLSMEIQTAKKAHEETLKITLTGGAT